MTTVQSPTQSAANRLDHWLSSRPRVRGLVRDGMQVVNAPLGRARLRRELARAPRPIWLEIGGHTARDRWLVTNVNALTRFYLDATTRWPLDASSVQYVYSDNVIEHLPLAAARAMLTEAHRCMQAGGVIRIVTPDLRSHVEMYLSGDESLRGDVPDHYRSIGQVVEHPVDLVRIPVASFGHHAGYLYDFETLAAELGRAGFRDPVRCPLGESSHAPLRDLELRGHSGRAQLAVEAVV